jgi:hypothetical protein
MRPPVAVTGTPTAVRITKLVGASRFQAASGCQGLRQAAAKLPMEFRS